MQDLVHQLEQARERWAALSAKNRVLLLTLVGVLAAGAALYWAQSGESADAVLYANLEADDAARIVERLGEMRMTYEVAENGTAIMVPEERVHETRLTLAGEGLPSGGGVGFEIFDQQVFGESEFAEQVKYHRALEGELSRTIGHLSGVQNARVHLVLPQRSLFASEAQNASASVALRLAPGFSMNEDRVRGIVHLVASSVRGLATENVTIVDASGRRLSGGEGADGAVAEDALEYRREIESAKERAVQQMLDRTLGPGKSIVRVAADVSFTREERTEETFDPEAVAPRSFQIDEERDSSSTATAGGVPGTVSNLPGGESAQAAGTRTQGLVRRSETRNFEISKTVRRAVEPVGRVQRLQVAVMVDGTYAGEGADREFTARPAEELERLEAIVAHAVGANTERGDRVSIECVPFAEPEPVADVPAPPEDLIAAHVDPYRPYLPYAGGVLGLLLLVIWLLVRKLRKKSAPEKKSSDRPRALPTPISVRELENGVAEKLSAGTNDVSETEDNEDAQLRMLASELAEHDPEVAARVVRGWLSEGGA